MLTAGYVQAKIVAHNNIKKSPVEMKVELRSFSIGDPPPRDANSSIQLVERDDGTPTTGEQEKRRPPLFPMPSRFWCPKAAVLQGDGWDLLNGFTTDVFEQRMRASPGDLRDTCVFYSRIFHSPPNALSRAATQMACQYGK